MRKNGEDGYIRCWEDKEKHYEPKKQNKKSEGKKNFILIDKKKNDGVEYYGAYKFC